MQLPRPVASISNIISSWDSCSFTGSASKDGWEVGGGISCTSVGCITSKFTPSAKVIPSLTSCVALPCCLKDFYCQRSDKNTNTVYVVHGNNS